MDLPVMRATRFGQVINPRDNSSLDVPPMVLASLTRWSIRRQHVTA
jgi:hypothetical protein